MIRKTLALAAVAVLAFLGTAPAASAQDATDYVPTDLAITCSPTSPTVGETFTCTATGFDDGTTVTFTIAPASGASFAPVLAQDSGSTSVPVSGGSASADFTVNTAGTYTVTATGTANGAPATASTTITVQEAKPTDGGVVTDGGLAQTGASNTGTLLAIAGGAVLLGGLALIGARARRQTKGATL